MLRSMTTNLLENGKMETTFTRAKEVQPLAEKMITLGKDNTLASYRKALGFLTKEDVAAEGVQGDCSQLCRAQRRLHPRDPSWAPQRRLRGNGNHRIGLIFAKYDKNPFSGKE